MTKKLSQLIYIKTKVARVWEQMDQVHVSGIGKDATFKEQSRGWFVSFQGSYEALFFGHAKPDLEEGDEVRITFQKVAS